MCAVLRQTDVDQRKYCGHSFLIGAATTAATKGIEDSVIKTLGRWESVAYIILYLSVLLSIVIAIVFRSSIASVLDNKSHGYARCQVGNVIRLLQVHVAYNHLLAILYNYILLAATWG